MQTTTINTAINNNQAITEEGCWKQISAAINAPGNPVDKDYVNQQAVGDYIGLLCQSRAIPYVTPILQACLYLEWRGRYLTQMSEVWVDDNSASLAMPWIEIDGRLLEEEDFESGQFSDLGKAYCLTYPSCAATDGDVVNLNDIISASKANAFPVGMDVLAELQADCVMPTGKLDYLVWAQLMRLRLAEAVSRRSKSVRATVLQTVTFGCQPGVLGMESQVCQLAELMLDGCS